jgi:hypothetical protein
MESDPVSLMGPNEMIPPIAFGTTFKVEILLHYYCLAHVQFGGLIWCTDGTRMADGSGAGVCGVLLKKGLSFSLGVHFTMLQSEICVISAFAKDSIQRNYT